ncbi:MAG TPA: alpha/beta fold hydrolase [Gemmatimonadaceae bacterium]
MNESIDRYFGIAGRNPETAIDTIVQWTNPHEVCNPIGVHQAATGFRAIGGVNIFYREAGNPSKPTIVLLHGFPSSSYSFHDLIPLLADRFHVIAPDYPGMGYSDAPAPTVLRPTFDDVAAVIDAFIAQCAGQ